MIRWTPQRKAKVVREVALGALTFEDAKEFLHISPEELQDWMARVNAGESLKVGRRVRHA